MSRASNLKPGRIVRIYGALSSCRQIARLQRPPFTSGLASLAAFVILAQLLGPAVGLAAVPVMPLVKTAGFGTELINNGGFEQTPGGKPRDWAAAPKGFVLASGQGRDNSQALSCASSTGVGWYGASQTVPLNRTNVLPLLVRGWSKALNVSGSSDSDYSLYVDLRYTDGTPLWGQTANFRTGTHDWERRELVILPEKPIQSLTLHCLFRNHSGEVWFDDVSVSEVQAQGGVLFQGVPVMPRKQARSAFAAVEGNAPTSTQDGLILAMHNESVASLKLKGKELAIDTAGGFLVRDVASNSDFFGFESGSCAELGLKLKVNFRAEPDHIVIEGRLSDTRGQDRAVTLVFALPLDALGWRWGDDIRHSRLIDGQAEFSKSISVKCGSTGTMSLYPLGAIWSESKGLALALDMGQPALYRLAYHAGTKQLFLAYDFGLAPETERFPGAADFRFVLYRFNPHWGFRAAFQKLMTIYPDYFQVRSREQGLWMPFTDISTVQGWKDFGFKYHEGNNNVAWDDAHGILSFRYTEPMTWWMRMPDGAPRTTSEAVRLRDAMAQGPRESERQMAQVSQVAGMWDQWGQPCLLFRNEPWCNGAVWSLNPNPHLPVARSSAAEGRMLNAATVHWNDSLRQALYGAETKGRLDGEYLDSLEGYVTADLNFRREHFRHTTVPLTFATETKQPALFKGLAVFEFTRWISDDVHRLGKLTFANGVPYRFTWLCPWLDVLATETDWVHEGKYRLPSDEQMSLWRTMAGAKPYLLLMNTDYDVFTPDMVEGYFQRSLFYGMFPGMFSHNAAENPYWQNPKWYNRDRPLFKKYIPLIKRVAEAEWQPLTGCDSSNATVFVERFGPNPAGTIFFTCLNDSSTPQRSTLRVDPDTLPPDRFLLRELVSGKSLDAKIPLEITLNPQEVQVIEAMPRR